MPTTKPTTKKKSSTKKDLKTLVASAVAYERERCNESINEMLIEVMTPLIERSLADAFYCLLIAAANKSKAETDKDLKLTLQVFVMKGGMLHGELLERLGETA